MIRELDLLHIVKDISPTFKNKFKIFYLPRLLLDFLFYLLEFQRKSEGGNISVEKS